MIILTSLCGGDGNALKHDGIEREDMNAALINTPPSAENLKLKAGMPSQERPLIYSSVRVCVLHHRRCRKHLCGATNPSFFPLCPSFPHSFFLSSFFIVDSAQLSTHLLLLWSPSARRVLCGLPTARPPAAASWYPPWACDVAALKTSAAAASSSLANAS